MDILQFRIFTEQIPDVFISNKRKTKRLSKAVKQLIISKRQDIVKYC